MSKCFIVLGMHRSATSLTAKGLKLAGVHIGDNLLCASLPENKWGHWEDRDFMDLNTKILKRAGGSWDNPPSERNILQAGKQFSIEAFIRGKEHEPLWGWKDPRTTLTIRVFMPYLKNPHFICNFRGPADVAESLFKRDKYDLEKCQRLAAIYNRRLLRFLEDFTGASK